MDRNSELFKKQVKEEEEENKERIHQLVEELFGNVFPVTTEEVLKALAERWSEITNGTNS